MEQTEQAQFERDLKYIRNSIIAKMPNGNYCKYSRLLNALTVINKTETDFLRYWQNKYAYSKYKEQILEAVKNKFENNLTPVEEMTKLVMASKEYPSELALYKRCLHERK